MLKKLQDYLIYLDKESTSDPSLAAIIVGCVCAIIGILTLVGCIKLIASIEFDAISFSTIITNLLLFGVSLIVSFLAAIIPFSIIAKWVDDEIERRKEAKRK